MIRFLTWLVAVAWLLPGAVGADLRPAQGKLLVATELIQGELFAKTVVLMLHYDETGAFGLVVNRPTDVKPGELLADEEAIAGYSGTLYWGGPVHMDSLRALMLTDDPPEDAEQIVESVYLVSFEDALESGLSDPAVLRFFIGYAGWAPGQLDFEMARGSWRVLPASADLVFAEEPSKLWKRLAPAQEQHAADMIFHTSGSVRSNSECQSRQTTRSYLKRRQKNGFWMRSIPGRLPIFHRCPNGNDGSPLSFCSA